MFGKKKSQEKSLVIAIIVAAGSGSRMKSRQKKQFMMLGDKPVLAHTLAAFSQADTIDKIIVVTQEEDILTVSDLVREFEISKVSKIITGGDTRRQSVYNALLEIEDDDGNSCYAAIHDGARPFISPELIDEAVITAQDCVAVTVGTRVKDTIKRVSSNGLVAETLDREYLWNIQTPQVFEYNLIKKAHEFAEAEGIDTTDDCSLVEGMGKNVYILEGDYNNIKITTEEDMIIAQAIYEELF